MSTNNGGNNNGNGNGKRPMKRKGSSNSNNTDSKLTVLEELYYNKSLRTKVENLLDEGKTYSYIVEFCKEQGLDISEPSITNYKKKRNQAYDEGVSLEHLINGRRKKGKIVDITSKEVTQQIKSDTFGGSSSGKGKNKRTIKVGEERTVWDDVEILDLMIEKGRIGVEALGIIDPNLLLRTMEVKDKITGGALKGVSIAGLKELGLRQEQRENAIMEVMMQYIDESKHEEVFEEIERAEHEFLEELDLTENGKKASQALEKLGGIRI